jgi:RNA polymerase sigma-70 factor, ECF subfamily
MTVSAFAAVVRRKHVLAGDDRARFETEAIPYMRQMFPAALRLTRDWQDAEDLVQETFMRAYLKFHLFRPGTNLRAWLSCIMLRTFYTSCRKRRHRRAETPAADPYDAIGIPARAAAASAEAEALARLGASPVLQALRELPENQRTAVFLADVQGYHYRDVAAIMGIPAGTVGSRIYRGRRLLREKLQGCASAPVTPRDRPGQPLASAASGNSASSCPSRRPDQNRRARAGDGTRRIRDGHDDRVPYGP